MPHVITPIPTAYAGCRFRSRLEARYAVFFDHLRIRWSYEQEGFDLGPLGGYLPDFLLIDWPLWVEVKGAAPTSNEHAKCAALAAGTHAALLVQGLPNSNPARLWSGADTFGSIYWAMDDYDQRVKLACDEDVIITDAPWLTSTSEWWRHAAFEDGSYVGGQPLRDAKAAATSARFDRRNT